MDVLVFPPLFIEFFSGIGGMAFSLGKKGRIVAAYDQDRQANACYEAWHGRRPISTNLVGLSAAAVRDHGAVGWLLSPPCQPYTEKGARLDVDDPRARPLLNLIDLLPDVRPQLVFLENVPGFYDSFTRRLLIDALKLCGLEIGEFMACPSTFGIPNRRRRYYLVAAASLAPHPTLPLRDPRPLADYLDPGCPEELDVSDMPEEQRRAIDIINRDGIAACFGSSYGHARARAGSYLRIGSKLRRFSPAEILRLLDFPQSCVFPPDIPLARRWALAGNSINVPVAKFALDWLVASYMGISP